MRRARLAQTDRDYALLLLQGLQRRFSLREFILGVLEVLLQRRERSLRVVRPFVERNGLLPVVMRLVRRSRRGNREHNLLLCNEQAEGVVRVERHGRG